MSKQTAQDLADGLQLIKEKGWTQVIGGKGPDGELCAVYGINNALVIRYAFDSNFSVGQFNDRLQWALNAFAEAAGIPKSRIASWNDDPSTSFEDVELAFKKAIFNEENN